jgi:hypothetical protein
MARNWLTMRVPEDIVLETPSGEGRIVIRAGRGGREGWEVYAGDELITRGTSASILPQCLVDGSAPSARDRGLFSLAVEFDSIGMALLEEQRRGQG